MSGGVGCREAGYQIALLVEIVEQLLAKRSRGDQRQADELRSFGLLRDAAKPAIEDRQQDQGQSRRREQPADHHDGQRLLDFRSGPVANNSGTSPSAVMLAVISTGRSRRLAPSMTISSSGMPWARNWLK